MRNIEFYIREILLKRERVPDYTRYPFQLPAVKKLDCLQFRSRVVFFAGENGAGKSTLLEAIAVNYGFNPEGGSRNFAFSTRDTHSILSDYITVVKGIKKPADGYFLRAESFYNVATQIDKMDEEPSFGPPVIQSYGGLSLHKQSHGESFVALVMNRFGGRGLYILDEPEAALSPTRQLALLTRISDLVRDDSQFIISSHSPILMAYPGAQIFVINENGILETPYEETEHYIVTRQFLNQYPKMLQGLVEKA